ncbi:MAG: hypothetical protein E7161_02920 [Firmicutes bacterium]|nr:hypothetical protein [Bacillota bacterium]
MLNLLFATQFCNNLNILRIMLLIKKIFNLIMYILPVILIIITVIDFGKSSIANDDVAIKKSCTNAVKRVIAAIVVILLPTLMVSIISFLIPSNSTNLTSCLNITEKEFEDKKEQAIKECNGENLKWSEQLLSCQVISSQNIVIETPDNNTTYPITKYANELVYYNQCNSSWGSTPFCKNENTLCSSGCGATSLAVMASTFSSKKYTPNIVASWICNNTRSNGGLSYSYFTNKKLLEYLNISVTKLFSNSYDKTYNESKGNIILSKVKEGKGVILYIPGHYVALGQHSTCNSSQVYLYDVGNKKKNGCYTPKELFEKTYNNKNRCADSNNCGWKGAWAFEERG